MSSYSVTSIKIKITGTSFYSYHSFELLPPNAAVLEKPEVIMALLVQDIVFLLVMSEGKTMNCNNSIPVALPREQPPGSPMIKTAHRQSLKQSNIHLSAQR